MAKETESKKLKLFNTQESPILPFFLLLLISISLMSYDHRYNINYNIKQYISALNAPIKFIINTPSTITQNLKIYLSNQEALHKKIKSQRNEINLLRLNAQKLQSLENENTNLRKILQIKEIVKKEIIIAEIVLPNQINGIPQVIINKGAKDNIKPGTAVMNSQGLIGQVTQVNNNSSKITPTTSNQFAVSAISNKGSINGIISGTGGPFLEIQQLPAYESLAIGDYFLTSGLGGIYPRGIKIGKVTKIIPTNNSQFNRITITPFSSPLSFSEVMLIRNISDN
jgi:rod shape-determining protein MreC